MNDNNLKVGCQCASLWFIFLGFSRWVVTKAASEITETSDVPDGCLAFHVLANGCPLESPGAEGDYTLSSALQHPD